MVIGSIPVIARNEPEFLHARHTGFHGTLSGLRFLLLVVVTPLNFIKLLVRENGIFHMAFLAAVPEHVVDGSYRLIEIRVAGRSAGF